MHTTLPNWYVIDLNGRINEKTKNKHRHRYDYCSKCAVRLRYDLQIRVEWLETGEVDGL